MVVSDCHLPRASLGRIDVGALVSQRAYARRRGGRQIAVWKRTTTAGGPIPVHGPRKRIDVAEADALWHATMSPSGPRTRKPPAPAATTHPDG